MWVKVGCRIGTVGCEDCRTVRQFLHVQLLPQTAHYSLSSSPNSHMFPLLHTRAHSSQLYNTHCNFSHFQCTIQCFCIFSLVKQDCRAASVIPSADGYECKRVHWTVTENLLWPNNGVTTYVLDVLQGFD